jgi:hypothetical protein
MSYGPRRKVLGSRYVQRVEDSNFSGSMTLLVLECGHIAFCNPIYDHRLSTSDYHECMECQKGVPARNA